MSNERAREEYLNAALETNEHLQRLIGQVEALKSIPIETFGEVAKANPEMILELIELLVDHIQLERTAHLDWVEAHFALVDRITT